jgi:hypothetical protein
MACSMGGCAKILCNFRRLRGGVLLEWEEVGKPFRRLVHILRIIWFLVIESINQRLDLQELGSRLPWVRNKSVRRTGTSDVEDPKNESCADHTFCIARTEQGHKLMNMFTIQMCNRRALPTYKDTLSKHGAMRTPA